jgi:hypothetical protein
LSRVTTPCDWIGTVTIRGDHDGDGEPALQRALRHLSDAPTLW